MTLPSPDFSEPFGPEHFPCIIFHEHPEEFEHMPDAKFNWLQNHIAHKAILAAQRNPKRLVGCNLASRNADWWVPVHPAMEVEDVFRMSEKIWCRDVIRGTISDYRNYGADVLDEPNFLLVKKWVAKKDRNSILTFEETLKLKEEDIKSDEWDKIESALMAMQCIADDDAQKFYERFEEKWPPASMKQKLRLGLNRNDVPGDAPLMG